MPVRNLPSRRSILQGTAAGGLCIAASYAALVRAQPGAPTPGCGHDEPTEPQIEGPYFKPRSPDRADLVVKGTHGRLFELQGSVLTRSCRPVVGALLDLWHADENGDYDNEGFRYRAHLYADKDGRYRFQTIMPGLYPGRTRHYHFKVQAPRRPILTTQLYFPDEPENILDDYYSPELLMRISSGQGKSIARFDFILDLA